MGVGTYALTTVDHLNGWLPTPISDTATADRIIDATTQSMEDFCRRQFKSRSYTDWIDGVDSVDLPLPNYPISILARVCTGTRDVLKVYNTITDATYATALVTATGVTLTIVGGTSASASTLTWANNATITLLRAAVVALLKGWQAEIQQARGAFPSTEIKPIGANACLNDGIFGHSYITLVVPDEPRVDIQYDAESGIVHCPSGFSTGFKNTFIAYTAGYASGDPELLELEQICLDLCGRLIANKARDMSLESESIGDYSWTARAVIESDAEIATKLANYRRVIL